MIEFARGNLLSAEADALVNTVNTEGVMGKGVALQFRRAFPENYDAYRVACKRGEVEIGRMFVTETHQLDGPRLIINFPTKRHWRSKSKLADIDEGLADLRRVLIDAGVRSVAVPALGCGLGGLRWSDVKPLIEAALGDLGTHVLVYPPQAAPSPERMRDERPAPTLTPARAALIGLISRYVPPEEGATPMVVQKLVYFLLIAGEPLQRLKFVRQKYGPYADAARHLVQALEGHYLSGYGDGTGSRAVRLLPGAAEEAETYLRNHPATLERFERIGELVDGFESPYGLELLATTHWVAANEGANDREAAIALVRAWSARKERLFTEDHIGVAWNRLEEGGWLTGARALTPA
jgi:O-acetyl-ADP-ribose deacetylase (regulator of RNase III)